MSLAAPHPLRHFIAQIALGVLLLIAIGLVIYGELRTPTAQFKGKLKDLLPPAPAGWTIKERVIADTPEMKQAVGELLNYDDGVFVDYINGEERISVYMAYWKPGKMSHRLVATHTPDVCWVGNGWKKIYSAPTPPLANTHKSLPPGEDRIFTVNGNQEYVWFWHTVDGKTKSYDTSAQPPWYAALTDLAQQGLNQRNEQFFIRISSNQPLPPQLNGAVLPMVIARLPMAQGRNN